MSAAGQERCLVSLNADRIIQGECVSSAYSGNYPIEHRAGEIERLHIQSGAMAPDALAMLDRIGPIKGWTCLDIGCGPGGITDLLSARVGPAGRVVGLDMDAEFLEHARWNAPSNVEFRLGDAYGSDLSAGTFDLVHMRFVASTAGNPEQLLKEATRLARPGGIVALQEPDGSTLNCYPPHPAWDRLKAVLLASVQRSRSRSRACKAIVQSSSSGRISGRGISDSTAWRSFH